MTWDEIGREKIKDRQGVIRITGSLMMAVRKVALQLLRPERNLMQ